MGDMIVPLLVVVIAALAVIGFFVITRYPISTWRAGLRDLSKAAREKEEPVEIVPQDVRLDDLMTREGPSVYTRTDSFPGLVGAVEKAMTTAEGTTAVVRRARAELGACRGGPHPITPRTPPGARCVGGLSRISTVVCNDLK